MVPRTISRLGTSVGLRPFSFCRMIGFRKLPKNWSKSLRSRVLCDRTYDTLMSRYSLARYRPVVSNSQYLDSPVDESVKVPRLTSGSTMYALDPFRWRYAALRKYLRPNR